VEKPDPRCRGSERKGPESGHAPGPRQLRSRAGWTRQHRPAHREHAGHRVRRGWHPPALRHPQHDPPARGRHLLRDRRGARPPRQRQGPLRPGRPRALGAGRRLARLGRRGRRHGRGRAAPRPRGGQGQPLPPRRHRAPVAPGRRQRPPVRPAAAVLHRVGLLPRPPPRGRGRGRLLAAPTGDRRRPPARQRVARPLRRGPAGGRQGRVGRPQRHPRHRRHPDPDAVGPRPGL
ncbi:MAG: FIG00981735: hypothetical protein, partial [uncultured Nocardioides sp.]